MEQQCLEVELPLINPPTCISAKSDLLPDEVILHKVYTHVCTGLKIESIGGDPSLAPPTCSWVRTSPLSSVSLVQQFHFHFHVVTQVVLAKGSLQEQIVPMPDRLVCSTFSSI